MIPLPLAAPLGSEYVDKGYITTEVDGKGV